MASTKTILPRLKCYRGGRNKRLNAAGLCLILTSTSAWSAGCFEIPKVLPNTTNGWLSLQKTLQQDSQHCLTSSAYFALYGAAQLNSGQLQSALESLERALLLDANNGAALIDYASALYHSGQIFAAIDLNQQLLSRDDLPANLQDILRQRAARWRDNTRTKYQSISVHSGYDSNLNGATDLDQLTLSAPGGDISLPLDASSKARSGQYLSLKTSHQYTQHNAFSERRFSLDSNLRHSGDHNSNYLQLTLGVEQKQLQTQGTWYFSGSLNYLHYAQKPLSAQLTGTVKYQWRRHQECQPFSQVSLERLSAIKQHSLDSNSLYTGLGIRCSVAGGLFDTQLDYIVNNAVSAERPGGDRRGWQLDLQWQKPLFDGVFHSRLRRSRLVDSVSYSTLLSAGARRRQTRTEVSLEYRRPLGADKLLSLSLNRQHQASNIDLFTQRGTRIGIGFKQRF